jgi:hypothetical protein
MTLKLSNPLAWLSEHSQKYALLIFGSATIILLVLLSVLDQPLKTDQAPGGIISFEIAKDFLRSQSILTSWDQHSKLFAALSLGLDFLFLIAYSLFLSLLCFKTAERFTGKNNWFRSIGIIIAWLQFLAALFDSIENYALIQLLLGSQKELFSSIAYYFAVTKFLFILSAFVYLIAGFIMRLFFRKGTSK